MNFSLKATGFINEVLTVTVSPDNGRADSVCIKIVSNALYAEADDNGKFGIVQGSFALANCSDYNTAPTFQFMLDNRTFPLSLCFSEVGEWEGYNNQYWGGGDGTAATWVFCKATEVEEFLKELTEAFYSFHKSQNEVSNLTIQTIKSLRIEDIVGEQSWEVVKTSSRRGSRRG